MQHGDASLRRNQPTFRTVLITSCLIEDYSYLLSSTGAPGSPGTRAFAGLCLFALGQKNKHKQ